MLPTDAPPGWYAHYNHRYLPAAGWTACDIRAIVRTHQAEWLDAFDRWHAELCRSAARRCRSWWLTAASRPNVWMHHETLKPLCFATAVREWLEAHPACGTLHLVGCPQEVGWYLEEFECGTWRLPSRSRMSRRLRALWTTLRELRGRFLRYVVSYSRRRPPALTARVLFYSHVVQADALQLAGDHFFGGMLAAAESQLPADVVTAYLLHEEAERQQASRVLQASGRRFVFLLDHLTIRDVLWVVLTGARTCLSLRDLADAAPPIQLGRTSSRLFGWLYLTDRLLGRPAGLELAVYRAMRRLLARTGVRTVVYPYEEKGLERAILQACSEAPEPVRTLAYAHPAHTTCHLALRTRPEGRPVPPPPHRILTTGPRAQEFFVSWAGKRPDEVVTVGSPRYSEPVDPVRPAAARRASLRVLVLTGHGYELPMLANLVERRPDLFADSELVIRPYSFGWFQAQDQGLRRLAALVKPMALKAGDLREQLRWCDVALFSSTSAGLQAMLAGRLALSVGLHDLFEADPLLGEDQGAIRCDTPEQLAEALGSVRAMGDGEYAQRVARQRAFARSVFAPLDSHRLIAELRGDSEVASPAPQAPGLPQSPEPSTVPA
jgi:hypothetical protein